MPTLNDITKKAKTITDVLVNQVVKKAPIKTGRLRKALKAANNVNTVFEIQGGNSKIVPVQSFEFTIDYAPDGAEYGKFWNEPTLANNIKKGKTKNIPQSINFAEKAILTPEFQRGIDELVDLLGETIATNIVKDL